jgi:hypothetical protein
MSHPKATAPIAAVAALALACAGAAPAKTPARHASRSPLASRELWATVDVCNPRDQPDTIGIRGSMPGNGNSRDALYMRFQIQYADTASKRWTYVKQGADSGFLKIGSAAAAARQAGRSFQFAPVAGKPAFTLRGVVTFQWRRGSAVLLSTYRTTAAGHRSSAGADPKGYSAASCTLA